ncbi:MAG TPA: 3-dehydroquinate synthase [Opitutaceae bacterium]|nr:3-dehydroquinate synthase [Opitutaceae bacterium]
MIDSLNVNLGERSYPLRFGADLTAEIKAKVGELLAAGRKVVVVTDTTVRVALAGGFAQMFDGAPIVAVEPGEESKSLPVYGRVLDFLAEQKIDRGGVVFAVGGGVIGDLAGFAAASYLRGVDFIQIPTTLLAMVDSSVGGKTGINLKAGKNLVGAFHQPRLVYIATDFLHTLALREFAAGMAEIIKTGLLGEPALFEQLECETLTPNHPNLAQVIRACCALKARVVEADERETAKEGGRALLNLGHTFGHAIEQVTRYGEYLHGEAVAIGLVAAAHLSAKMTLISPNDVSRIERVIQAHGLPLRLRQPLRVGDLMSAVARDKKVRSGLPRFILLKRIGEAATESNIDPATVEICFRLVGATD